MSAKKNILLFVIMVLPLCTGFAQSYIPMPSDSATWRYRFYNVDYVTQVIDCILYVNGTDTVAPAALGGRTYHKVFSRSFIQTVPNDSFPPNVSVVANYPDTYYGAIRDSGQHVYFLTLSGETELFDFSVAINDSIPAYSGKVKVIAIDSVLLDGTYHRRFLTSDSTYYSIEGVGSNRGLIPGIDAASGPAQFFCFTDSPTFYTPDAAIACTRVYPAGYGLFTTAMPISKPEINISPNPAIDILHITTPVNKNLQLQISNCLGETVWTGNLGYELYISVASWPKGLYYVRCKGHAAETAVKKILVQ